MLRCSGLLLFILFAQAAFAQDTTKASRPGDTTIIDLPRTSTTSLSADEINRQKSLEPIDSASLKFKISTVRVLSAWRLADPKVDLSREFSHPDTVLNNIQNFNPNYSRTAAFQDLGFQGSPSKPLRFDQRRNAGFNIGIDFMDPYFFDDRSLKIYKAHNSYTAVQYTQGTNQLLWLKLTHAQNLSPNFNIGVDFQRLKHDGYFLRTSPSVFNTRLFAHYSGKKYGRYHAVATAIFNRADLQESGGFRNDSLFEEVEVPVNIRLTSARNKLANTSSILTQYYRFGKKGINVRIKDSITLETDTVNTFDGRWQLFHEFRYETNRYTYSSRFRDTLLYDNFYYDTASTLDSIHHRSFTSRQGISFKMDGGIISQFLQLSALVQYNRLFQKNDGAYEFTNSAIDVRWDLFFGQKSKYINTAWAQYYFSGYNQGDYRVEIDQSASVGKHVLFIHESLQRFTQPFIYTNLRSNHFNWSAPQDPTSLLALVAGYYLRDLRNLKVYGKYEIVNNYTYLDTAVQVMQLAEKLNVIQAVAEGTLSLGNFRFYNQIIWQSDNSDKLRLPVICSKHSWYYQRNLRFRNPGKTTGRMLLQTGIDAFYRTEWRADAWNPAARNFHLQDQVSIGNYPQIDVWAAAKVRTVDLYIKLEHANQGLMGARYYTTPHYALYPRSFRFGLLWRFF